MLVGIVEPIASEQAELQHDNLKANDCISGDDRDILEEKKKQYLH